MVDLAAIDFCSCERQREWNTLMVSASTSRLVVKGEAFICLRNLQQPDSVPLEVGIWPRGAP